MTEQELFLKVFCYQTSKNYISQFEVLQKPTIKIPIIYADFLKWVDRVRMYSCYTNANDFNPQVTSFKNKIPWHDRYNVFTKPLKGLNMFECLALDIPDNSRSYIQMRIGKILSVTLDIINTKSVANAVLYKQELDKVHPFTNLVCAHQLLNKPMRTIYCLNKTNEVNKNLSNAREITTLTEIVNNYENIPIGFLEQNYLQLYCEHDGYRGLDPNGYIKQPAFDVEHFVKTIQTSNGIIVKLDSGNVYTIPDTDDIRIIEDYNKNYKGLHC